MVKGKSKYAGWTERHRKGKVNVGTYIEPETKLRLERAARINSVSIAQALREAILNYIAAQK